MRLERSRSRTPFSEKPTFTKKSRSCAARRAAREAARRPPCQRGYGSAHLGCRWWVRVDYLLGRHVEGIAEDKLIFL
eukprot:3827103-Prymnesium_polylepis.2